MKAAWTQLTARFDALQSRERWLVALAVLGGILLLGYTLVIDPALQRGRRADRLGAELAPQLASLQSQLMVLRSPDQDPDVRARAELAALNEQIAATGGRLAALEHSLVPPQRMASLLEDMIGQSGGLRLLSLKTLPVAPVLGKPAAPADATTAAEQAPAVDAAPGAPDNGSAAAGLYRHGIEIRLQGSYHELTAYLQGLERSPMKLLWSSVSLDAGNHPRLVLTLIVYTLSLDRAWLIV